MNIGTDAARKKSSETLRSGRFAESQLRLPLEIDSEDEAALRAAWTRCGLRMPYHVALQNRPLAICLTCLADAMQKKACIKDHGANAKRRSNRSRK